MSAQTQSDLQQLTETVSRLSEALAASERRHASMARAVRWGSLAVIVLVAGAAYAASDRIKAYAGQHMTGKAEADQPMTWYDAEDMIAKEPPQLDGILMSLMGSKELQGALVKVLQSASLIATQETNSYLACVDERKALPEAEQAKRLCFSEAAVEDLGMFYLDKNNKLPQQPKPGASDQEKMAYSMRLMEGTLMAAGQTIVDGAALVHRLRRDSDLLRRTVDDIGGAQELLRGIKEELHMMNGMLVAIPAMANEMNAMNQQISVMSYSVGSTMGRMGNMLPW